MHDVAQVCQNGHVVTTRYNDYPEFRQDYCDACGTTTTTTCPRCEKEIRGSYRGSVTTGEMPAPAFCLHCGGPFPLHAARVHAAKALVEEIDELSAQDKLLCSASIDDIAGNTPMTDAAIMRIKKVIAKAGQGTAEALKKVVLEVASEAARKAMLGQ
jgi:hypothetical protein